MFKDPAIILDAIEQPFLTSQQQQLCLPQFKLILDGHLSHRHLPAPFSLETGNTT
jgi:hypothetical protein